MLSSSIVHLEGVGIEHHPGQSTEVYEEASTAHRNEDEESESKASFVPIVLLTVASSIALKAVLTRPQLLLSYYTPLLLVVGLFMYFSFKRRRLPPGPTPIPLIGNMIALATGSFDDTLQRWRTRYGEVFTVWIGPIPLVMVCSLRQMKRFFVDRSDIFSNRWRNHVTDTFMGGHFGVVQSDGDLWREQRRFSLHVMRNFGVGRPEIESVIVKEIDQMVDFLRDSSPDEISLSTPIAICVGNVINSILFGKTFPQGSSEMHHLHELLDAQSELVVHPLMGLYIAAPWTTNIPLINRPWLKLLRQRDALWGFLEQQVEEHLQHFESGDYAPDFTYTYMEELRRREMDCDGDMGSFSPWQMRMLLLDLFFAGMETTVTTLKWAFLLMAAHPEAQLRVQAELDSLGERSVRLADRKRLPYTNATISEIQRIANILPINLLRTAAEDADESGWHFPRGTLVIPQISVLLQDPRIWSDPSSFSPERFLEADGATPKRIPEFLPFSIGRRQCLGESLARAELFLIFTNTIKALRVEKASELSRDRPLGLTVSPKAYSVRLYPRVKVDRNENQV